MSKQIKLFKQVVLRLSLCLVSNKKHAVANVYKMEVEAIGLKLSQKSYIF